MRGVAARDELPESTCAFLPRLLVGFAVEETEALLACLIGLLPGLSREPLEFAYGSAVAGLGTSGFLGLRTGPDMSDPCPVFVEAPCAVRGLLADPGGPPRELEADVAGPFLFATLCLAGDSVAIAEFGRSGSLFAVIVAFFWAAIVSLRLLREDDGAARGLESAPVPTLLVKFVLDAFGFDGSFSSSCFDFASRPENILFCSQIEI